MDQILGSRPADHRRSPHGIGSCTFPGSSRPATSQSEKKWIDLFIAHSCYYRCVVVDWRKWEGKHFGDPFEPESLKKRRAYKKWAEMLLQPELKLPDGTPRFCNAAFYLDKLRILYGYDVLDHLRVRFTGDYHGSSPYIELFQHTDSWKDANQCLQLCDLLTGCLYQSLVPAQSPQKREMRGYLDQTLAELGVQRNTPSFWRGYAQNTLTDHFPKFSAWFWRPARQEGRKSSNRVNADKETRNLDGLTVIGDRAKPKPSASAPGFIVSISLRKEAVNNFSPEMNRIVWQLMASQ